jgi:hypothetical protein
MLTRSARSSSCQIATISRSTGVRGSMIGRSASRDARTLSGAGSALRSTLPWAVSGRASSTTTTAGTMCSGSSAASSCRTSSARRFGLDHTSSGATASAAGIPGRRA